MALFIHSKVIVCFYVVCTIVTYLQSIKQSEVIIIKHFKNILNYAYFIYIYSLFNIKMKSPIFFVE